MPDNKILVSRPYYQGLGLGLETGGQGLGLKTWCPRSWSWSRDLVAKVLVLRPGGQGLGLGLELFSKVLITSLQLSLINHHIQYPGYVISKYLASMATTDYRTFLFYIWPYVVNF